MEVMSAKRTLPTALLRPAARALNGALGADPVARRQLDELVGRRIAVEIEDFDLVVPLVVEKDGVSLGGSPEAPADTTVSGTLASLIRAGRSGSPKGLAVSGDAEAVHGLARAMARLPGAAWERVAQVLGDVPARGLERFSRSALAVLGDARDRFTLTLSEYLQHEARVVVPRAEVDRFLSEVDRLRSDSDRLVKRIERLERGTS